MRNALQELQQIIITPIKAYVPPCSQREAEPVATPSKGAEEKDGSAEGFQSNSPSTCDGESSSAPIGDGDIAGQFTRVMGKGELQQCPQASTYEEFRYETLWVPLQRYSKNTILKKLLSFPNNLYQPAAIRFLLSSQIKSK